MGEELKEFDVTKHVLVPKHEIVSEEEKQELIRKYGDLKYFPKISVKDPVIRRLGAKPGDVVKIMRPGARVPHYRVVTG